MELLFKVLSAIGSISAIVIGIVMAVRAFSRDKTEDKKEQLQVNNDLEVKVKELEGKMSTQYSELKAGILSLEKTISDDKAARAIFENRILASVDRIQDLVIKVIVNNPNK